MSRKLTTIPGEVPRHTLRHQAHIAEAEVALKSWRIAQPWVVGLLALGLATLLHYVYGGAITEIMVALGGIILATIDGYLRSNRKYLFARYIGPVSVLAATAGMVWLIAAGFSGLLGKVWLLGGVTISSAWDFWILAGHHKDDVRAFGAVADSAGLSGMQFTHSRKDKAVRKKDAPVVGLSADGVLQFPPGMTMDDVTKALPKIESASGSPRGSWTVSPHPKDSRQAHVRISDPERLDNAPLLWPGPSAEGESIAVPLRPALMQNGEPLSYSLLNHHALAMGVTGSGKALDLNTLMPTPAGWTTMGELSDGDQVFDEAGKSCRVVRAWPVRRDRPCYEVKFSDGSVITADAEHLWQVDTRASRMSASRAAQPDLRPRRTSAHRPQDYRRIQPEVVTTEQLAAGLRTASGHTNYSVRVAKAIQCSDAVLPVPPYTLGAWLGDGSSDSGSITTADQEVIEEIEAEGFSTQRVPSATNSGKASLYRINELSRFLVEVGVRYSIKPAEAKKPCSECNELATARGLCRHHYYHHKWQGTLPPLQPLAPTLGYRTMRAFKHIPLIYLRASEVQRRALLAGLLDTDGHCTPSGTAEFANSNERLARDVLHLVSGLGYKASLRSKTARLNGKDCGTAWTVSFTPSDKVFRITRKVSRQVIKDDKSYTTSSYRYITAVEPVASRPVRCITVDSPSSLYLVGEACIPTHNTMSWCYGVLGDAITRHDFVCLAADGNKGRQFLGAMEPALHHLAISNDEVLEMMSGISRIADARTDYLTKNKLTEWQEGCGLVFLDVWLEEAADVVDLIKSQQLLDAFKSLLRGLRSRGMRLDMSTQRNDWEEIPTFIRSQLARVCFGVENEDDAKFGLTGRQRRLGCAPDEWQTRYPGKFYIDAPTIPVELIAMPMRGWYWGNDTRQMEAYAATWPAEDRPMDDVTGEAWEATPGKLASLAFPVVKQGVRQPRPASPPPGPPKLHVVGEGEAAPEQQRFAGRKMSKEEARKRLKAMIEDWRCEGRTTLTWRDIDPVAVRMGYSSGWGRGVIAELETEGVLRKCTDKRPAYWEIVAQADAEGEADS